MIQRIVYLGLSSVFFLFSSCNGEGDSNANADIDSVKIDTSSGIDTLSIAPVDSLTIDSAGYINEEAALSSQIEQKYGEQWDFCDCVVKNDSVNKAIMETEDDAAFEVIVARMEVIDQHCKELLTAPNTTPDERAKHERKVNKCLRAAK